VVGTNARHRRDYCTISWSSKWLFFKRIYHFHLPPHDHIVIIPSPTTWPLPFPSPTTWPYRYHSHIPISHHITVLLPFPSPTTWPYRYHFHHPQNGRIVNHFYLPPYDRIITLSISHHLTISLPFPSPTTWPSRYHFHLSQHDRIVTISISHNMVISLSFPSPTTWPYRYHFHLPPYDLMVQSWNSSHNVCPWIKALNIMHIISLTDSLISDQLMQFAKATLHSKTLLLTPGYLLSFSLYLSLSEFVSEPPRFSYFIISTPIYTLIPTPIPTPSSSHEQWRIQDFLRGGSTFFLRGATL